MAPTTTSESPPRVAVFRGDDAIGREKAREALIDAIRARHEGVTEERWDPSHESFEEYTSRMITPSLFSAVRIFHVRHADGLSERDCAALKTVLKNDVPDVHILVELGDAKAAKALKALGLSGAKLPPGVSIFSFEKPPDYKLAEWLSGQVPLLFKRRISRSDAEYLVECTGTDLDAVYSELQKLDIHLLPAAPIDRVAIESLIAASRIPTSFELARALGKRDLALAMDIVDKLFGADFYAPLMVSALYRHFWGLFRIRAWANANPDDSRYYVGPSSGKDERKRRLSHQIGVAAGLMAPTDPPTKAYPIVVLSGVVEQARGFTDAQLKKIIGMLVEFDVGAKTGAIDPDRAAVRLLCYRIGRIGSYGEPPAAAA